MGIGSLVKYLNSVFDLSPAGLCLILRCMACRTVRTRWCWVRLNDNVLLSPLKFTNELVIVMISLIPSHEASTVDQYLARNFIRGAK